MTTYRALVSIEFDDSDLEDFANYIGVEPERLNALDVVTGELDSLSIGCPTVEQIFEDGRETVTRLTDGITVEINPH